MMPAGEELDAAVAKVLGWTFHTYPPDISPYWTRADGMVGTHHFSTDPAHIAEMLAWLTRNQEVVTVQGDDRDAMAFWRMLNGTGDTIQHALANLIVQVAERKEPTP